MPILFCTTSSLVSAGVAGEASLLFISSGRSAKIGSRRWLATQKPKVRLRRDGRDRNHRSMSPRIHEISAQIVARHQGTTAVSVGRETNCAGGAGVSALFCG